VDRRGILARRDPLAIDTARGARKAGGDAVGDLLVSGIPRDRHDDVAGDVVGAVVVGDGVPLHAGDDLRGADHLATQRPRDEVRREQVVHEVVGRVVAHPDLFEDDLPLGFDLVDPEGGCPDDVGEDVEGEIQAVVDHSHVVRRALTGGERVHLAADGLDRLGDLSGAAGLGALEQQVLEEVRRAGQLLGLVA